VRLLFASLLGLLAAVAAGILFSRDSGRVLINLGEWSVQTTVSFFFVAIVVVFVVGYALVRTAVQLVRLPRDWSRWSAQRRSRRSEQFLLQALAALLERDWAAAERAFRKGASSSRAPSLNYLGAAQSAERQGAAKRRDQYLQLAREPDNAASPEIEVAIAALRLEGPAAEQAYAALKGIEAQHPRDERARIALLDAALRRRDWEEARRLLERVEVSKKLSGDELRRRQIDMRCGLLQDAAARREELEEHWRGAPAALQREPRVLGAYVAGRLRHADTGDCEPLLRREIERGWDAELVDLYGRVQGADAARQLRTAESWLERHAADGALLLALGRVCRRCELWGKAREYLEESVRCDPQPAAFLELGALHTQQGDPAAASDCYRRGLERAAGT
jgi:HemY protein